MLRESQIGRIQAFTDTCNAVFMTLNGGQMITFKVLRWNNAKGGMRFAFPPYGLFQSGNFKAIPCSSPPLTKGGQGGFEFLEHFP